MTPSDFLYLFLNTIENPPVDITLDLSTFGYIDKRGEYPKVCACISTCMAQTLSERRFGWQLRTLQQRAKITDTPLRIYRIYEDAVNMLRYGIGDRYLSLARSIGMPLIRFTKSIKLEAIFLEDGKTILPYCELFYYNLERDIKVFPIATKKLMDKLSNRQESNEICEIADEDLAF